MFAKSACKVSVQSEAPGSGGINGQLAVCFSILLAPVVQTLDSAIQWINKSLSYPLDSDLSGG